jgi:hypothetical protein
MPSEHLILEAVGFGGGLWNVSDYVLPTWMSSHYEEALTSKFRQHCQATVCVQQATVCAQQVTVCAQQATVCNVEREPWIEVTGWKLLY